MYNLVLCNTKIIHKVIHWSHINENKSGPVLCLNKNAGVMNSNESLIKNQVFILIMCCKDTWTDCSDALIY